MFFLCEKPQCLLQIDLTAHQLAQGPKFCLLSLGSCVPICFSSKWGETCGSWRLLPIPTHSPFLQTLACNVGSLCREYGPCYSATVPFRYKISPPLCMAGKYQEKGENGAFREHCKGEVAGGSCSLVQVHHSLWWLIYSLITYSLAI